MEVVDRKRTLRLVKKLERLAREQAQLRRHLSGIEKKLFSVNNQMAQIEAELDIAGSLPQYTPPTITKVS